MIAEILVYVLFLTSFSLSILRRSNRPGLSRMKTLDSSHVATAHRKDGGNFLR